MPEIDTKLLDAAREVLRAWHEDTNDLNSLADAIQLLEEVLEERGYPFAFTTPQRDASAHPRTH